MIIDKTIRLLVCDMAGTVINENGIVYNSIYKALKTCGMQVEREEINNWHGIYKKQVIEHFVKREKIQDENVDSKIELVNTELNKILNQEYFKKDSKITLIAPNLLDFFSYLRSNDIKIALNTGYPQDLQESLINKFNLKDHVDLYISSEQVKNGRPYPYMIHHIMEELNIESVREIIKVGDSIMDIKEGINAGCKQSVGVLSGASSKEQLENAGAHQIIPDITHLLI
jgi:phosphonatase-like hydrolase